jgi:hypothetical protein
MNLSMHLRRAAALYFVSAFVGTASAGTITHSLAFPPGPDPVIVAPGNQASVPIVTTPSPNNDNVPGVNPDNNIDVNNKRFNVNVPIDIVFTVAQSGGVTEYRVVEQVDNNTGIPWVGYRMQLGYGIGVNFQLAAAGDPLDFDAPLYDTPPTSGAMIATVLSPNELVFSGFQAAGAEPFNVRIDVPDLELTRLSQFTLRQIPIAIPEPASLVLFGIALLGFASLRRRR